MQDSKIEAGASAFTLRRQSGNVDRLCSFFPPLHILTAIPRQDRASRTTKHVSKAVAARVSPSTRSAWTGPRSTGLPVGPPVAAACPSSDLAGTWRSADRPNPHRRCRPRPARRCLVQREPCGTVPPCNGTHARSPSRQTNPRQGTSRTCGGQHRPLRDRVRQIQGGWSGALSTRRRCAEKEEG